MAKAVQKLSARGVATMTTPGRHSDGGGLYLNVTETGARSWLFMWKVAGRRREMGLGSARDVSLPRARAVGGRSGGGGAGGEMGLGSARDVSLARAREVAAECRAIVAAGRDPLEARAAAKTAERVIP